MKFSLYLEVCLPQNKIGLSSNDPSGRLHTNTDKGNRHGQVLKQTYSDKHKISLRKIQNEEKCQFAP